MAIKKEIRIWAKYALNSFQQTLVHRVTVALFLLGKLMRIGLFLIFLTFLFNGTENLAGFGKDQIIFFYLSFAFIDTLSQFLFRGVYSFRRLITSGDFDFVLVKPASPVTRVLLGSPDVMDLIVLLALAIFGGWFVVNRFHPSFFSWLFYILLIINGLLISAAFHIAVLGLGIITYSIDHLVLIYRDLAALLRIPVDLYIEPIRFIITFLLPLGIMITFPAKLLLGLLSPQLLIISFLFGFTSLSLALKFWRSSLKSYQSASS